jgi:hypothetical protein
MFDRLASVTRRTFGRDATLNGIASIVAVEHGVEITGYQDDQIIRRSVATVSSFISPKKDDVLIHPDGTYKLDALISNNGSNTRWTLKEYAAPVV